jgi:hypothetical protein
MSSNQIFSSVPVFDGSNYRRWADKMKAYFQIYNLWGVTSGVEKLPKEPQAYTMGTGADQVVTQPTEVQMAEYRRNLKDWTRDNEAALGAMTLKMRDDLEIHWKETAAETWEYLETKYGKQSQAQVYQLWKELTLEAWHHISSRNILEIS